jgi:hypothetical protein
MDNQAYRSHRVITAVQEQIYLTALTALRELRKYPETAHKQITDLSYAIAQFEIALRTNTFFLVALAGLEEQLTNAADWLDTVNNEDITSVGKALNNTINLLNTYSGFLRSRDDGDQGLAAHLDSLSLEGQAYIYPFPKSDPKAIEQWIHNCTVVLDLARQEEERLLSISSSENDAA